MNSTIEPRPFEGILGRKVKTDRILTAQTQGRHVPNGWPHYSTNNGLCMCLDLCCNGKSGCRCKFCPCQWGEQIHGKRSESNRRNSHASDDMEGANQ